MVTILPCRTKRELRLFERTPELIHKKDPYYVPPFPGSVAKIFGPQYPFVKHGGTLLPFVAYRDGKPVGRIAAIINPTHNQYHNDKVGFFGFFDAIDDAEVASQLLEAAEEKLAAFGLTTIRGPYSPTVNDECGLLVEGYESTPFVMMPYNPPYYTGLYDQLGFKRARDLYAFYVSGAVDPPERMIKIVEHAKHVAGITIRDIDLKNLEHEMKFMVDLYNVTLNRNWGFVPLTYDELAYAAKDLKAIVDPSMIIIAEKDGIPVGFSMTLPNINELLWRTRSLGRLMRILKFAWLLKTSRPKEARLVILGVAPEFRNKGIASIFYFESLMRAKGRYLGGELSWIEESNQEIIRAIEIMGAKRYKSYRIFEKDIGGHA